MKGHFGKIQKEKEKKVCVLRFCVACRHLQQFNSKFFQQ